MGSGKDSANWTQIGAIAVGATVGYATGGTGGAAAYSAMMGAGVGAAAGGVAASMMYDPNEEYMDMQRQIYAKNLEDRDKWDAQQAALRADWEADTNAFETMKEGVESGQVSALELPQFAGVMNNINNAHNQLKAQIQEKYSEGGAKERALLSADSYRADMIAKTNTDIAKWIGSLGGQLWNRGPFTTPAPIPFAQMGGGGAQRGSGTAELAGALASYGQAFKPDKTTTTTSGGTTRKRPADIFDEDQPLFSVE